MSGAGPWWRRDIHADRRPFLLGRSRIQAALRRWFDARGFVEVDPSILQASPGNEAHLHAFATELQAVDGSPRGTLYLHTSPEFACKKLLAAGETRLFAFAHVFRNRERGPLHHPEFTMLEWYRAGEPYQALMEDCHEILGLAAAAGGLDELTFRERAIDPMSPPERVTVAQAFRHFAGIDLLASIDAAGHTRRDALAAAVRATGGRVAADDSWADLFSRMLVERIEPHLGQGRATVLCEYPVAEAALARPKPGDPRVAERFELYVLGMELANAYTELNDPAPIAKAVNDPSKGVAGFVGRGLKNANVVLYDNILLGWDQETVMPEGSAGQRAEEIGALEGVLHARRTDPRIAGWLKAAKAPDAAGEAQLRLIRRSYARTMKVPAKLAEEIATVMSLAQGVWAEHRAKEDVAGFLPTLVGAGLLTLAARLRQLSDSRTEPAAALPAWTEAALYYELLRS